MISVHDQMLEVGKLLENLLRNLVNLKVENVQNIRQIVADDRHVRVVFNQNSRHFTHVILNRKVRRMRALIASHYHHLLDLDETGKILADTRSSCYCALALLVGWEFSALLDSLSLLMLLVR